MLPIGGGKDSYGNHCCADMEGYKGGCPNPLMEDSGFCLFHYMEITGHPPSGQTEDDVRGEVDTMRKEREARHKLAREQWGKTRS